MGAPHQAEFSLVRPSLARLAAYEAALRSGWSPDNIRGKTEADRQLAEIAQDRAAFVAGLDDPEAQGRPLVSPEGTVFPRLPGFSLWIWDGDFCGAINLRWRPGGSSLPDHVLGHIGYAVVPWKRGAGAATAALRLILPEARVRGLDHVLLSTDADNLASQRVILNNAGYEVERFRKLDVHGGAESIRFRIDL
jgi:predicted acetyltransferase